MDVVNSQIGPFVAGVDPTSSIIKEKCMGFIRLFRWESLSVAGFDWVSIEDGARRGPSSICTVNVDGELLVGIVLSWVKIGFSGVDTN